MFTRYLLPFALAAGTLMLSGAGSQAMPMARPSAAPAPIETVGWRRTAALTSFAEAVAGTAAPATNALTSVAAHDQLRTLEPPSTHRRLPAWVPSSSSPVCA